MGIFGRSDQNITRKMSAALMYKCTSCENNELCDYTLSHNDPNLFDRSQWCPQRRVSTWYVVYRVFMAVIFIVGVTGHGISCGTGAKWFIFMTDLGVMFLALHYCIDAALAVS